MFDFFASGSAFDCHLRALQSDDVVFGVQLFSMATVSPEHYWLWDWTGLCARNTEYKSKTPLSAAVTAKVEQSI